MDKVNAGIPACTNTNRFESLRQPAVRLDVLTIETAVAFTSLNQAWNTLTSLADECPQCLTYEYCEQAAAQVFARGGVVNVAIVLRDDELLALWPVAIYREKLVRIARALTCGSGEEYGGPLLKGRPRRDLYRDAAAAVMRVHADVLEVGMLQHGSLLHEALGALPQSWVWPRLPARWRCLPGYSIRLGAFASCDDFMATRPKSLRSNLRYCRKRLETQGKVEFGWAQSANDATAVLTWLFANKRCWAISHGLDTPYLMDDQVRDFFIELAQRIDLPANPLVAFVKVAGVPVAASVNLVGSNSFEYFITTYDAAFGAYSVGALLVEFLIRWSHANGREFDFRPLHADYKARWANCETWHERLIVMLNTRGRLVELPLLLAQTGRVKRKLRELAGHLSARLRGPSS
jgi:CelD/BcsL family acetyltransferase involved in cellulose biosynthesis